VEFLCELPNEAYDFTWLINGKTAPEIGQEPLEERGITPHNTIVRENNRTFTAIGIDPRVENNITILLCLASFFDTAPLRSAEVTFRVQGLLDPPTGLEIVHHNATHQVLRWTPPFTLDLTAYEDDITGFSVTLEMQSPPPRDPYDLSVSRDLLDATTTFTWSLSGTSPEFFFPRYAFPVWLSVRAENPVGPGAPSPLLHYSPPTSTEDCTRLKDLVSDKSIESKVKFTNSALTPTVEILLYRVNSKNMCIDSVMVVLSAGDESASSSSGGKEAGGTSEEVLIPEVRETEISVVLGQHLLDPHTHYTAILSLQQQQFSTVHFSTHHVQRVIVKEEEEGSGLVVECVFAEGSPQNTTCTVVVEGEGGQWVETFRGPLAFPHLPTGNYTVSVYDGEMKVQEPAVVTVAEVSGVPSSTPTFTDGTTLNPAVADHSKGGKPQPSVLIGASGGLVVLLLAAIIICLVVLLRLRRNARSASCHVELTEGPPNASNPIVSADLEGKESSYDKPPPEVESESPRQQSIIESPYEVVDQEEARALRERKEREKREKARSAPCKLAVFTEEELREIRSYSNSTNKIRKKQKKRDKKKRDSSPPPVPPQAFNYHEDFPEEGEPAATAERCSIQVAPDLPPRSPHMRARVNRRASSPNGSRYPMIEGGPTSSPALLPRPRSADITLFPTTGSGSTGVLTRDPLGTSGKNGSLPLLASSELKHNV
jgi:hypothetical protein